MNYFTKTSPDRVLAILGEQALARYSAIFEAIREEYFIFKDSPITRLFQDWHEFKESGFYNPSNQLTKILEDEVDLGLLHLLQKEGVKLPHEKLLPSARIIDNLQSAGLAGMNLSPELSDDELKEVLKEIYERVIQRAYTRNYSEDEQGALERVNELRQTNPQMISLARLITRFSYRDLIGIASPEVFSEAPILADLMGMNSTGVVDYKTWASNEAAFNHAALELFLTPHLKSNKKFSKANESMHFSNVMKIGLTLSALPAQNLVLQGHDPKEIMQVLKRKLAFLYTYKHGDNPYTSDMVTCHTKMAFLPFPRLWPELNIKPEDFLGRRIEDVPEHSLPLENSDSDAWMGITRKAPMQRLARDLAKEGIFLDDAKYRDRSGYALGYFVNVSKLPLGAIDEMIWSCNGNPNHIPNIFKHTPNPNILIKVERSESKYLREHQHFIDCLSLCNEDSKVKLLVKLFHENRTDKVVTCDERYMEDKKYYMRFIGRNDPQLFSKVLDSILSTKKPKAKIVEQMLTFGAPSPDKLEMLSEYQAGKLLEVGLGL